MGSTPRRSRVACARRARPRSRPGATCFRTWLALGLGLALAATPLRAQDPDEPTPPPPPADTAAADTAAADTAAGPGATVEVDTTATGDTVALPPVLVRFREPAGTDWRSGVWEWDRDALMASSALTLTHLLERIPGLTPLRFGYIGMPEAVTAFGLTGGRVEVVLDGYALDPLDGSTVDLAAIELNQLRRVRVERRLDEIRIEIETDEPTGARPYSRITAGTGDVLDTQLLRGMFMAPGAPGGPLALGVERLSTDGLDRSEPAVAFAGWLKWSLLSDSSGLQLEYRRNRLSRDPATPLAGEAVRQDWVLRARGALSDAVTTEAFVGLSSLDFPADTVVDDEGGVDSGGDEAPAQDPALRPPIDGSAQAGLRARYTASGAWAEAETRLRGGEGLPELEAALTGGARLPGPVRVEAGARVQRWHGGERAAAGRLRAEAGPLRGVRVFAETTDGHRGIPALRDSAGSPVVTGRSASRIGAEYASGRLRAGVAAVRVATDSVPTFGLPFDRVGTLFPGGTVQGWEASARVPSPWRPLALEASYSAWPAGERWIYLPDRSWRLALDYHHLPMESGNLELFARLETHHRGSMAVPAPDGLAQVPGMTVWDFTFQVRVLSVRAFMRWENLTHQRDLFDFPGRVFPGQRLVYGVKWEFLD